MKYLLGYDIGSSSVKACLLDINTGTAVAAAFSPSVEMEMLSPKPGFAEQEPERWWAELINATNLVRSQHAFSGNEVAAIGISYQMHGMVVIDQHHHSIRPSIIWCDSRAVETGNKAFDEMGEEFCLSHYLNSPGNFTASKLKWMQDNEPDLYSKVYKVMLPGDYIALKLTGEISTTVSGLSEGIFWDFKKEDVAEELLSYYKINPDLISPLVPQFGEQGKVNAEAAAILGLRVGIPVSYRAGDQPNNAYSLNVLHPGEIAATAGTSGVVYGVSSKASFDPQSRVNSFVHVSHTHEDPRYGILLCVNGTGSLNSWLRKNLFSDLSYKEMNDLAAAVSPGAEGVRCYPFGNGAERVLANDDPGAGFKGIRFNQHTRAHMARAAQEGIVFALQYGIEIMQEMGMEIKKVRAGHANMFLSEVFAQTFADTTGCEVELYNTDGAQGAARAAGVGAGIYKSFGESFTGMNKLFSYSPHKENSEVCRAVYNDWKKELPV